MSTSHLSGPGFPPVPDPAQTYLHHLPPPSLDALVIRWLESLSLRRIKLSERRGRIATYEAVIGDRPLMVPVRVRVIQRLQELQVHHVEAFLGHLLRVGAPVGILVTTGTCSWAAGVATRYPRSPYIRLCSGSEWSAELAALGLLPKSGRGARHRHCLTAPSSPRPETPGPNPAPTRVL